MSPEALVAAIADAAVAASVEAARRGRGVRLGVEGPVAADAETLADGVAAEIERRAVPVARVRGRDYLRARSLRLEHGADDPDTFLEGWYDLAALRREVLDPLADPDRMTWLPGLRDADTDRPLRLPRAAAPAGVVAVVDAPFLARWEIADAVDVLVHLDVSPAARARRVPPAEQARVLPAWERYLTWFDPAASAALVVRYDRPSHPALMRPLPDGR